MASYIFDQVKRWVALTNFTFVANDGVFKIALMDSRLLNGNTVLDGIRNSAKSTWGQVKKYEITRSDEGLNYTGYVQSPLRNLGSTEEEDNSGDVCDDGLPDSIVYATNVTFPVSTIDAYCAVITRDVTGRSAPVQDVSGIVNIISDDDELVAVLDLSTNNNKVSSNQGVFTLKLDEASGGYLKIK